MIDGQPVEFKRPRIPLTKNLKTQNYYTLALNGEFGEFAFNEERAPENRGLWREKIFRVDQVAPIDLEIGTGNGIHFLNYLQTHPQRNLVGLEIKYKPLIQSIRRARVQNLENGRICRFHAFNLDQLFADGELNNIFMHFPDPWTSPRKPKNRMINPRMLELLHRLQKPNSFFELKTDSQEFFDWAMEHIAKSPYQVVRSSTDLHSETLPENYVITAFERIFMRQNITTKYVLLKRI